MKKYFLWFFVASHATSFFAMKMTSCETNKIFRCPNGRPISIEDDPRIVLLRLMPKEKSSSLEEKLWSVTVTAKMSFSRALVDPYFVVQDEKNIRIFIKNNLEKYGIALERLIITIPHGMQYGLMNIKPWHELLSSQSKNIAQANKNGERE